MNTQHLSVAMSGTALLAALNELRAQVDLPPLKGWSESKDKLLSRIEATRAEVAASAPKAEPKKPAVKAEPKKPASPDPNRRYGAQRFTSAAVITVNELRSPKKHSGRNPYQHYATGRTVAELLALGVRRRDINYDAAAGHITVTEPANKE